MRDKRYATAAITYQNRFSAERAFVRLALCSFASTAGSIVTRLEAIAWSPRSRRSLVAGELISGRLFSYDTSVAPTSEEIVVSLALVAPLAFGPRAPVAVFATVMVTCLVQLAVTEHVLVADLAPLVASTT